MPKPNFEPDRWGYTPRDYAEAFTALNDEFVQEVYRRASDSFVNVLLGPLSAGVQNTGSLNHFIEQIALGTIVWAALEGYVEFTEKTSVDRDQDELTDEERADFDAIIGQLGAEPNFFQLIADAAQAAADVGEDDEDDEPREEGEWT